MLIVYEISLSIDIWVSALIQGMSFGFDPIGYTPETSQDIGYMAGNVVCSLWTSSCDRE